MILLFVLFFGLLVLGVPIFAVIFIATMIGALCFSDISSVVLVQQAYEGCGKYLLLAIPFFIMSGALAAKGGTGRRIVDVMQLVFGRFAGGLLIAAIFACAYFAAISGSNTATAIAIGSFMIPILVKQGYPKPMVVGAIITAGTLGILIPPSAPMVSYCVLMQTSVADLFAAGVLPGILMAICWSIYVYIYCKKNHIGTTVSYSFSESCRILKESFWALLFPIFVLGGIYSGISTPTEAAAISVIYVVALEFFVYKTMNVKTIYTILRDATVISGMLTILVAVSMMLTWFVTTQQVPVKMLHFIHGTIAAKWLLILGWCLLFMIVGCFIDTFALLFILAPMMAPTLESFNINLTHFGVLSIALGQIGTITPPFGLNLFVGMSIGNLSMPAVVKGVVPFLLILIVLCFILAYVPEISLFLPNLAR